MDVCGRMCGCVSGDVCVGVDVCVQSDSCMWVCAYVRL